MGLHHWDRTKLEQNFEKTMLIIFAEGSSGINQVLGNQEYSLEDLRVLTIEEVTTSDQVDKLSHEIVELLWVLLGAVMDHSRKGGQTRRDISWNVS